MRRTFFRRGSPLPFGCLIACVVLVACSREPVPERDALTTGTVRAAVATAPGQCPAIGSCVLIPDRDTTVYSAAAKDYGKSHELCVGSNANGSNGSARALLHFDLGLLPANVFVTAASLSLQARRSPAASGSLSVFRLTSGTWSEGDGTGVADGHLRGGCTTCGGTGACGWTGTGANGAQFAVTSNVGSATATSTFAVPGTVTFNGMEGDVRSFMSGSNLGWMIRASDETSSGVVLWSTDTATGDANKPALSVSYVGGPGASGCNVNSDCVFSNGTTGFCAPNHVCCGAPCADSNVCTTEMCDATGACTHAPNTNTCNDDDVCTTGDTCSGGACVGTSITCTALDQCHIAGTCSPASGCSNPNKPDGTGCDDGNACSTGETCQAGTCTGGTGMTCPPADQCHIQASCSGGTCPVNPPKPDNTPCDDGNACSTSDACQAGVCIGTAVTCPPADQCHIQSTCSAGTCAPNPPKPESTPCDDGNACSTSDSCQAGVCTGTAVVCPPADQCHIQSTCSAGTCAPNPQLPDGTPCDDGNSCTTGEACLAGVCTGGTSCVPPDTFTMPLTIPTVLAPTSSDATTDRYTITVRTGTAQMRAGNPTPIVGFNGSFPGPTIVATKGRRVQVTQINAWSENITIHNHGHKSAPTSDGHPIDYVAPSTQKDYTYPNDQPAATYWYHDHTMDLTGTHVYSGLAGFYLIHDPAEDSLGLPSGSYDVPLMIQDKTFGTDNSLTYDGSQIGPGFLGNTAVVNGVVTPYFEVSTHKYRFRVLNASNSRSYRLALSSGRSFRVIGSDGGLLAAPVTVTSLDVAPAERYDVVIDFGQAAVGSTDVLTNTRADSPTIAGLVQFRITTGASDSSVVPDTLAVIPRLSASQSAGTTTLTFARIGQDWTINALTYDPARLDVTSTLGSIYVWELTNPSGQMHPFHKHLAQFQVLDIGGMSPPPEQSGWKDTIAVPAGATAHIIFKNETFTGTYVFHCHILEHEDHRMMLQESVVPPATGVIFTRMFGTPGYDAGQAIAADAAGNAYVTGGIQGSLDGNPWLGSTDVFLAKYSSDGTRVWSRELGSTGFDFGSGVAIDPSGNVYVAGYVERALSGNISPGGRDAFLAKYSSDGTRQWAREIGTSGDDFARGTSADSAGNVYVAGATTGGLDYNADRNGSRYSAFVTKYSSSGTRQWTTQFASSSDTYATGISAPDASGNVYVTGYAFQSIDGGHPPLPNQHFFIAKLSSSGQRLWTKQTTPADGILSGAGITAQTSGNIYATGYSAKQNLVVVAYDSAGNLLWKREPVSGFGSSIATDSTGAVYAGGATVAAGSGDSEAIVVKLSPSGALLGTIDNGAPNADDEVLGVAVDPAGAVLVTGDTSGAFPGFANAGQQDVFVQKLRL